MQPAVTYSAAFVCLFTLLSAAAVSLIVQCQMEMGEELLGTVVKHPQSIAIDSFSEMMFLVDQDRLVRSNLAGGAILVLSGVGAPHSVAVDAAENKLYWTEAETGKVQRSSYDGSDMEDVLTGLDSPSGIALASSGADSSTVQVVWGSATAIQTAWVPLVGSGSSASITDIFRQDQACGAGLAVDSDYVYWTSSNSGKIRRAALDGTGSPRDLVEGLEQPQDLAVNAAEDMMYWSESAGRIGRASIGVSIAGANQEMVVVTSEGPSGLAFDGDTSLYYGDSSAQVVRRTGVDGECLLYRALEDELIALIILGGALGIAVIGCCVVGGFLVRSRRAAKSSPPDSASKLYEPNVVPSPVVDSGSEKAAMVGGDVQKKAIEHETYDDDAYPKKLLPPNDNIQETIGIDGDEKTFEKEALPAAEDKGNGSEQKKFEREEVMEPEIEMPRGEGKCCLFCATA